MRGADHHRRSERLLRRRFAGGDRRRRGRQWHQRVARGRSRLRPRGGHEGLPHRSRRTFLRPSRLRESWPRHCVVRTSGVDFHPQLDTDAVEAVFRKGQYSAAYSGFEGADDDGTTLADWLRQRGVDEVDIVGIATDYCVQATAADAVKSGLRHPGPAGPDRRRRARVDSQGRRGHARRRRRDRLAQPATPRRPPASSGVGSVGLPDHFGGRSAVKARTPSLASS